MNAEELPKEREMPGKAMYHFPNPATRPSILGLARRQRRWLAVPGFSAFAQLAVTA